MQIIKTLRPGDMGTKQHLQKYGNQLVCVRYRIDKNKNKRYTTVELIVDEQAIKKTNLSVRVWVKIHYNDTSLRKAIIKEGARWLTKEKAWEMEYSSAKKLGLKKKIIHQIINTYG